MDVRIDAAGHHDLTAGVDDPRGTGATAGCPARQ